MKLRDYLKMNDISIPVFAKAIDVSVGLVHKILNGHDPKLSVAMKIEKITFGKVRCEDLLENIEKE